MKMKKLAIVLVLALGAAMLTGCGKEPEPLTDEAILLLMEREIVRRDGKLPEAFMVYHAEEAAEEAQEQLGEQVPEYSGIIKDIGRYIPEVNDYLSQADGLVHDVGDVFSQAQEVLSQVDELTSGAGKEILNDLLSEADRREQEAYTEEEQMSEDAPADDADAEPMDDAADEAE